MNTLGEIIQLIKYGKKPKYEELLYTVLSLEALLFFENRAIKDLAEAKEHTKSSILHYDPVWQRKESFNRRKKAMNTSPKDYVGWENDPENPQYVKRVELSNKIFNSIVKKIK